jgi:DNA-binding NtrC family response regulator
MKVLLVENKDACIGALMALLTSADKQVEVCHTLEEAEVRLTKNSIDVVIVSQELAGEPDFFKRLAGISIVIVTSENYLQKAMRWTQEASGARLNESAQWAFERKDGFERAERIARRMKERTDAAALLLPGA